MNIQKDYISWIKNVKDPEIQNELKEIENNEEEKYERFYKFIDFGTAGIRGIMQAGTNCINIYTIKKVTQGLANYLLKTQKNPSVVVSYDSRNKSKLFAYQTCEVLAGNGIKTFLVSELKPTPFLSFAVRKLNCSAGVMITASHNTSEYNGYKCYGEDGAQITEKTASEIFSEISKVDIFSGVKTLKIQKALENKQVLFISKDICDDYLNCIMSQKIRNVDFSKFNVLYTPLNGCGMKFVCKALHMSGIKNLKVVQEQKYPDGNFTTCQSPNPENLQAFNLAFKYAEKYKPDIIIATDPDADRLGICVLHKGNYQILSGNEIGVLLFYYIIKQKKELSTLTEKPVLIKSKVSTKMVNAIAKKENCEVIEVPTGFKNIAKEILNLEEKNQLFRFIFGFEESHGYLSATYARDKDAVAASVLACEAAAYFKNNNLSLVDVINKINKKYGYYSEKNISFKFEGSRGKQKIKKLLSNFKNFPPKKIGDFEVISISHSSDMICINLGNENEILIRPSGTEPKLKIYILVHSDSEKSAFETLIFLADNIKKMINSFCEV